jgi:hypothetical protein
MDGTVTRSDGSTGFTAPAVPELGECVGEFGVPVRQLP